MIKKYKIAIVHDYLRVYGGAEMVLLMFHKMFPKARIYMTTADFKRMGRFGKVFEKLNISTSWAQKIIFFVKKPILYRPILPVVWGGMNVGRVDAVISLSCANIAKAIPIPKGAIHFCYCFTPPRYLYNLETETNFSKLPVLGFFIRPIIKYLRVYDLWTNKKVDYFIASSKTIQDRIKKYYGRDSFVIYPSSKIINKNRKIIGTNSNDSSNYFLVVSRLVRYKHVDVIIKAFNDLGLPLRVIGVGPEKKRLEKISSDNVIFLGQVDNQTLIDNYKNCTALVVATPEEDFGLTPIEVQSYGKPVIVHNSGGLRESVINKKTGILFDKCSPEGVKKAIREFKQLKIDPIDCFNNSQRFTEEKFSENIKKFIQKRLKPND